VVLFFCIAVTVMRGPCSGLDDGEEGEEEDDGDCAAADDDAFEEVMKDG
jgi:hypothetical protein